MEQVSTPPDRGRASTSATSDDAAAPDAPAAIGSVVELASTIESSMASAVAEAASAAAVRVIPPVVFTSTVASIGAGNMAASILGSCRQMERMFAPPAAAVALANIETPFAQIGRWHENLMRPSWVNPVESMIGNSFSRMWERQEALFRSFAGPSLNWWDELDLWPTDGLMTGLFRPLDVARPQLFDMASTLDNLLSSARWIESFGSDLWRDLRHTGARVAYWAVQGVYAALARGDLPELEDFISCWLDAEPTDHRREALEEALLEIDHTAYRPEDGHQLLDDLARIVRRRNTVRRRLNETMLGMRRGRGGTITVLGREDLTVAHHLGHHAAPPLEDGVLNRIQPDVDPRVVELVNNLPYRDRRIAMLKIATGCAWSEAAVQSGAPAMQGEVVRRRLHRHRAALPYTADPWTDLGVVMPNGAPVGRLRHGAVIIDGATGIYP